MRHAGHPEWGYLAPAPSFIRTARVVLVATAIGIIAGAGIVLSLVPHPLTEASVSARTLGSSVEAAPERAGTSGLISSQSSRSPPPQVVAGQTVDLATNRSSEGSTRAALAVTPASAETKATDDSPAKIVAAAPAVPARSDPAPIKTMKKLNNAPHYASRGELLEPTQRGNNLRRHRDVYSETPAPGGYYRYGARWSDWSYWDGVGFYQDW
jgi:hypothetical protein